MEWWKHKVAYVANRGVANIKASSRYLVLTPDVGYLAELRTEHALLHDIIDVGKPNRYQIDVASLKQSDT